MSDHDESKLRERYSLNYQVAYLIDADRQLDLAGKKVLEVGGSLPERLVFDEIKVEQWIGTEDSNYWQGLPEISHGDQLVPGDPAKIIGLKDIISYGDLANYATVVGAIEEFPSTFDNRFDAIVSMAAFEHILKFPLALEKMFRCLKAGGLLYSDFAPVWSSFNGHHLPTMYSENGEKFNFSQNPVPPWGHLALRPGQLFELLTNHTDRKTAGEIVYFVHHSPHINRLFTEDYMMFFENSDFEIVSLSEHISAPPDDSSQKQLEYLYPGRAHFGNSGMVAILRKPLE
jgi:ubiquinone/menaquinone biosynthesis C-methylase UbiE